jgi:RNA polymerase primary sigma factor
MPRLGERRPPVRDRDQRDRMVKDNLRLSFFAVRLWAGHFGLDAEDARAECNLALIKAASLWRPDLGRTFAGYAVKAMFNHLVTFAKKEQRLAAVQPLGDGWERPADPTQYDPVEVASARAEVTRLREVIDRLDPRSQQVMQARAAGEETRHIAERLGVSRQRIEQIERRARERLRELLRAG